MMQDDVPLVGWPLLPLPVATLAQLLMCPWWHTDPPRTWTWRVYHGNQPLGRWSSVGFNEGGVLAAGPCLRPLPSLPAIRTALSAFKFKCKHGVSTRALLPDYLREGLTELERWAGIAYEQDAGRVLIRLFYGQCLAVPSELGGMRHHLGWGHPCVPSQGAPLPTGDGRRALSWDPPLFIHL